STLCHDTSSAVTSTLSLHDALPICVLPLGREHLLAAPGNDHGHYYRERDGHQGHERKYRRDDEHHDGHADHRQQRRDHLRQGLLDRKSTRLNSSHVKISYAVFCLKK